jgi:hypothetical protein
VPSEDKYRVPISMYHPSNYLSPVIDLLNCYTPNRMISDSHAATTLETPEYREKAINSTTGPGRIEKDIRGALQGSIEYSYFKLVRLVLGLVEVWSVASVVAVAGAYRKPSL